MKKLTAIIAICFLTFSCKSQVIGTLEQFEECAKRPNRDTDGCPDLENITYVKDTNNRLDQFVGTWKGTADGKNYTMQFIKLLNYGDYSVKWDELVGNILITDTNGNVLHNSFGQDYEAAGNLTGLNFQNRAYMMYFGANSYCNDSGDVFIEVSKSNPNLMYLDFDRDIELINPSKCPNYATYKPLLPKDRMTLVRQ